ENLCLGCLGEIEGIAAGGSADSVDRQQIRAARGKRDEPGTGRGVAEADEAIRAGQVEFDVSVRGVQEVELDLVVRLSRESPLVDLVAGEKAAGARLIEHQRIRAN